MNPAVFAFILFVLFWAVMMVFALCRAAARKTPIIPPRVEVRFYAEDEVPTFGGNIGIVEK